MLSPIVMYEVFTPASAIVFVLIGLLALFGAFELIRLTFKGLDRWLRRSRS